LGITLKRVKYTTCLSGNTSVIMPGDIGTVTDAVAKRLTDNNAAEVLEDLGTDTVETLAVKETAVQTPPEAGTTGHHETATDKRRRKPGE
jgi:hypothetical protein